MRVPTFQIDAFTQRRFSGNPAAVMVLDRVENRIGPPNKRRLQ